MAIIAFHVKKVNVLFPFQSGFVTYFFSPVLEIVEAAKESKP